MESFYYHFLLSILRWPVNWVHTMKWDGWNGDWQRWEGNSLSVFCKNYTKHLRYQTVWGTIRGSKGQEIIWTAIPPFSMSEEDKIKGYCNNQTKEGGEIADTAESSMYPASPEKCRSSSTFNKGKWTFHQSHDSIHSLSHVPSRLPHQFLIVSHLFMNSTYVGRLF